MSNWIVHVTYGDPNSLVPLTSAIGMFDSQNQAQQFAHATYQGTNYIVIEDNNNNLHKAWIWDCIPIASDKEVAVREHNLNVDYGFKAVSEKKYNKIFADLKKEITMKLEKEAHEIGADYANHTKEVTPGEAPEAKPDDAKERG